MKKTQSAPPSVFEWEPAAKIGFATIIAAVIIVILIIGGGIKNKNTDLPNTYIPNDAANLGLSEEKLNTIRGMLEPLLRGGFSPFDGADNIPSGEAVYSILSHLRSSNDYPIDSNGASLIPAAEVDALFVSLFGVSPPRGDVGTTALYNRESGMYEFLGGEYHSEYIIDILSTRTLDDVVYIHVLVKVPLSLPPSSAIPPSSVEESEVSSDMSESSQDSTTETSSDITISQTESTVTSEDESANSDIEIAEYETVRNAIFTLNFVDGAYIITELRDV